MKKKMTAEEAVEIRKGIEETDGAIRELMALEDYFKIKKKELECDNTLTNDKKREEISKLTEEHKNRLNEFRKKYWPN